MSTCIEFSCSARDDMMAGGESRMNLGVEDTGATSVSLQQLLLTISYPLSLL